MTLREFYKIEPGTVLVGPGGVLVQVLKHSMFVRGRSTALEVTDIAHNASGLCYYVDRRAVLEGRYFQASEEQIAVAKLIYGE